VPEARRDEPAVRRGARSGNEQPLAPPYDQDGGIHRRRRLERCRRQATLDGKLMPGSPDDPVDGARPWKRPLHRHAPLDDEIRPQERHGRIVEQMPQDRVRTVKGQVRDDPELPTRKPHNGRVGLDDVDIRPAPAEVLHPPRIELDGEDSPGDGRKLTGQTAASGAKVDDEVAGPDASVANELRGEGLRAKEVLAMRAARPTRTSRASLGHGPSPSCP
jgi:hypothetical protein